MSRPTGSNSRKRLRSGSGGRPTALSGVARASSVATAPVLLLAATLLFGGCDRGDAEFLSELERIEEGTGYSDEGPSDERIEELKAGIRKYRGVVEEKVEAAGQLGVYHKMLATAYMDRRMYGLALEHLEEAIHIQPENPILFYYAGVAAGRMAKSTVDEAERSALYEDAEQYYLRSIELDPTRNDANYALGVLYVFETEEPVEAREYLEQTIEDEPKNARAYMVLARSFAMTGEARRAADLYDQAAEAAGDRDTREAALRNRDALLEGRSEEGRNGEGRNEEGRNGEGRNGEGRNEEGRTQ
ncbi:MAG: tetratricopeptide repeat protein [Spirochaetaceae bacterium]